MTSQLSRIPADKRRRLAATLGLFAMLFLAVGAVALTGPSTVTLHVFVGIAFVIAVLLGLIASGVVSSVRRDLAEQQLDDAIVQAVAAQGASLCSCGHDHDPTELHVTDAAAACEHDGSGAACAHDCDTCVLAAMRPARATAAARPAPRPRPRPTRTP